GKGSHYCVAGGRYQVRVQGAVSGEQVDALFASYAGLTSDLEQWLRKQWAGFKPHWEQSTASAIGSGVLAGSWAAIRDIWDSIKLVQAILEDPLKFVEQLGDQAAQLARIAIDAPKVMEQAMLLASDEAALFLMVRTAMIWLDALPPSEIAEVAAGFVVSLLIDLVIGAVLTIALP
ncbi:type IV secretion protein Rhs, partial [Pseudomonas cedrina subsp. fulgida]|nr:type IV secretion protein Rhs [Pseudomonas cedrina subsp. fulgida]